MTTSYAPTHRSWVEQRAHALRLALARTLRGALAAFRRADAGVFLFSVLWLTVLEMMTSSRAADGVHFQSWTSDDMQQTLPIAVLRESPLRSLYYLHIQPPLLDALRSIVAHFVQPDRNTSLVVAADRWLYIVQVLVFGFTSMRMYQWARRLTDRWFAPLLWLAWIVHPAPLAYATLLDSTSLSSSFIFLFCYELWRLQRPDGSIRRLAIVGLCVFFTRTVFQWYYVPLTVVALALSQVTWRRITVFVAISALGVVPWLAKQKVLFGTLSTTTFTGYHQAGIIWYHPTDEELKAARRQLDYRYPVAAKQYEGGKAFNTESVAVDNLVYAKLSAQQWAAHRSSCIEGLWRSFKQNYESFWAPSSRYKPNVMVDALPWRRAYDWLFSGARYRWLLYLGALAWIVCLPARWQGADRRPKAVLMHLGRELAWLIIPAFVFATSMLANRYEWVENDRLKFFLDPLFFLFVATCAYNLVKAACFRFTRR
jgi:hypothetical protein